MVGRISEFMATASEVLVGGDERRGLFGPVSAGLRWVVAGLVAAVITIALFLKGFPLQSGERDIFMSVSLSIVLFGPVWLVAKLGGSGLVCGQVGFGSAIVQLVVIAFLLKGLLLGMWELSGDGDLVNPALSLVAGIVPLALGSIITVGGSGVLACLS